MDYRLSAEEPDLTKINTEITIHPCPYCDAWQVDFRHHTMQKWVQILIGDRDTNYEVKFDTKPFYDMLDDVIEEHMAEKHPAVLNYFKATGKALPPRRG